MKELNKKRRGPKIKRTKALTDEETKFLEAARDKIGVVLEKLDKITHNRYGPASALTKSTIRLRDRTERVFNSVITGTTQEKSGGE